jgi:hypothetical protein
MRKNAQTCSHPHDCRVTIAAWAAQGAGIHVALPVGVKEKFIMRSFQQGAALVLCWCLVMSVRDGFAYQGDASVSAPVPQAAHHSPDQLQQLAAPIALYPDALIAQILAAATYPDQVVEAERWREQHKDLAGDQLAKELDKQPWDPSLKALTPFASVLANMSQNLAWTSELGEAYVNQQQDLTNAIQVMRQRAKQAGNLTTTAQETVSTKGQTIVIHALAAPPRSGNGPRPTGKATGGLGFIAYPAEYRSSGVMTFVVSRNDVVYEKDLGPNTSTLAAGMGSFHKDASWHAADE